MSILEATVQLAIKLGNEENFYCSGTDGKSTIFIYTRGPVDVNPILFMSNYEGYKVEVKTYASIG